MHVEEAVPAGLGALSRGVGEVAAGAGEAAAGLDVALRPAKGLDYVLERRPCTSRSALQAYSNKVVISLYSL